MFAEMPKKLCIIGCGLMGTSLMMSLQGKGYSIWAVDTHIKPLNSLSRHKLAEHWGAEPDEAMAWAELTVFCTMPEIAVKIMAACANKIPPGRLVLDFCGVKKPIMQAAQKYLLPLRVYYVGAHPMAGREKGTFRNAIHDLYDGANAIITPAPHTPPEAIRLAEQLLRDAGCMHIIECSAEKHDEMIAFTSQLMHLLAAAIAKHPLFPNSHGYEGGSLQDFTRIATLDAEMWGDLCMANRGALSAVLKDYIAQLGTFWDQLEDHKVMEMKADLKSANEIKERWEHAVSEDCS